MTDWEAIILALKWFGVSVGIAFVLLAVAFVLGWMRMAKGHNQEWEDDQQMQYLMDWSAQRARERDLFRDAAE